MRSTILATLLIFAVTHSAHADELSADDLLGSINSAKRSLLKAQQPDGSWHSRVGDGSFDVGVTGLALLALLNCDMTRDDPEIKRGLDWLRRQEPIMIKEISLVIQALAAAGDGNRDIPKVTTLARAIEDLQLREGPNAGSWTYSNRVRPIGGADRCNGHFAILGLFAAQEMGVPVNLETWRRARNHWLSSQNADGTWSYKGEAQSAGGTGSMTVAGVSVLVMTQGMMQAGEKEFNADGTPNCCGELTVDKPLERALQWLGNHFAITHNPGAGQWLLYYLYGLEQAANASGRRFFVESRGQQHDWYREAAAYLVSVQNRNTGTWQEGSSDMVTSTSFVLMFLSKGRAPILINKLQYGLRDANRQFAVGGDWNRHPDDIRNLTQFISSRPKWPKLLNWQTVDVTQANVADLKQAPILFLSGSESPKFTQQEMATLREYIQDGGFLFVVNSCKSPAFDEGIRELIKQMYAPVEMPLKGLSAEHAIFRSEFNLLDEKTGTPVAELWGVDVGDRTRIVYSPNDLSCLWSKKTSFAIPGRSEELELLTAAAMRVGTNVVAYAMGREFHNKLQPRK